MQESYAVLVGLDWADQSHAVCWQEVATGRVHTRQLAHDAQQIGEWIGTLVSKDPGGRIAICLEQSRGAVVYALMGYQAVDLYPVNPVTLAAYRRALHPSGAKDDPGDAALLLELLQRHRDDLRLWQPDTEPTRLLRSLCEDRRKAVGLRTGLCNSLRAKLKEYFPQAIELVGDSLSSELSCAFLMKWPTLDSVAAARPQTVRRFYYAHQLRGEQRIGPRLALIADSRAPCTDAAVIEAAVLCPPPAVRPHDPSMRTPGSLTHPSPGRYPGSQAPYCRPPRRSGARRDYERGVGVRSTGFSRKSPRGQGSGEELASGCGAEATTLLNSDVPRL